MRGEYYKVDSELIESVMNPQNQEEYGYKVSHGYCPDCYNSILKEIRRGETI